MYQKWKILWEKLIPNWIEQLLLAQFMNPKYFNDPFIKKTKIK